MITGIPWWPAGGTARQRSYRALRYWGVWLAGVILAIVVGVQGWGRTWIPVLTLESIQSFDTLADATARWLIPWSLVVWMVWLYRKPITTSPFRRSRLRYLLAWVTGLIVLIPGFQQIIDSVVPLMAANFAPFTSFFPLLAIWTICICLFYLYHGDGSRMHELYVATYRDIWTAFSVVLLVTILTGYASYQSVNARVEGYAGNRALVRTTIEGLHVDVVQARQIASVWLPASAHPAPPPRSEADWARFRTLVARAQTNAVAASHEIPAAVQSIDTSINSLAGADATPTPSAAPASATPATSAALDYFQRQKKTMVELQSILSEVVTSTAALSATVARLAAPGSPASISSGDQQALVQQVQEVEAQAAVALSAISSTDFSGLSIFLWMAALYSALVLFPWMLLLLFLYRRRVNRATQILEDLERLDPTNGLLIRILSGKSLQRGLRDQRLVQLLQKNRSTQNRAISSSEVDRVDRMELIDALAARAFSNFEYLLSLMLLSVLLAIGWYFVLYPQASLGLASLIADGAGVKEIGVYLIRNLTPLTMGFVGAYFFLLQMLVRRYQADDLYPTAFLQASQRMLIIFVLSLAVSVWSLTVSESQKAIVFAGWAAILILVAFLAGIFPMGGLRLITATVNRAVRHDVFPNTVVPEPITRLTGVTVWTEARLMEENTETMESMATAPIEQLVLRTRYPTAQLVDWIDQALLYLHTGHNAEWFPQLRAVGIRGATDLLIAANPRLYAAEKLSGDRLEPDETALQRLVAAVTAARASGVPALDPADPRERLRNAGAELTRIADEATALAEEMKDRILGIQPDDPASYDYMRALEKQARAAANSTHAAVGELAALQTGAIHPDDTNRIAELEAKLRAADALGTSVVAAISAITGQPGSLTGLDKLQRDIADWDAALAQAESPLAAGFPSSVAQAPLEHLANTVGEAREQAGLVYAQVQHLDPVQPETLDARQELKSHMAKLQQAAPLLVKRFGAIESLLKSKAVTMTEVQKLTMTSALDNARPAIRGLHDTTQQAGVAIEGLGEERGLERLPQSRAAVLAAATAFQTAREGIRGIYFAVGSITAPPQLTSDILYEMYTALWPSPNMEYIWNFNRPLPRHQTDPVHPQRTGHGGSSLNGSHQIAVGVGGRQP
jgi:hypothetical protein